MLAFDSSPRTKRRSPRPAICSRAGRAAVLTSQSSSARRRRRSSGLRRLQNDSGLEKPTLRAPLDSPVGPVMKPPMVPEAVSAKGKGTAPSPASKPGNSIVPVDYALLVGSRTRFGFSANLRLRFRDRLLSLFPIRFERNFGRGNCAQRSLDDRDAAFKFNGGVHGWL